MSRQEIIKKLIKELISTGISGTIDICLTLDEIKYIYNETKYQ